MKNSLDQLVISSFKEFLNYKVLNDLNAFKNVSAPIYQYSGGRTFKGKTLYCTNRAQWVYDSSLSGAQIPTGINGLSRGESGLSFDFKNGRILVNSGTSLSGPIDISFPNFNFYISTLSITRIINELKPLNYPNFENKAIQSDAIIAPCIILAPFETSNNQEFLGGVEKSTFNIQAIVLSSNLYDVVAVQNIFRNIKESVFPLLSLTPFNELNDLKEEYWNYTWVQDWLNNQSNLIFVEDSFFKFLDIEFINENHPKLIAALCNFKLSKCRNFYNLEDTYYDIPYVNMSQYVYSYNNQVYIKE